MSEPTYRLDVKFGTSESQERHARVDGWLQHQSRVIHRGDDGSVTVGEWANCGGRIRLDDLAAMDVGDTLTIAGVNRLDPRSRWQRLVDRVLRRPPPKLVQQQFRIVEVVTSRTPPDYKTGKRGEHRIDTFFGSDT